MRFKTLWRERHSTIWQFYCPHCRLARRLPYRSRPGGARHFAQVGITAAFFALVAWPVFGWKGILSAVPIWTLFETFYRARMRAALECENCGFDPYLYLTDVSKARDHVRAHWEKRLAESRPGEASPPEANAEES
jgi:hypothetical protein